jgi:hypothetical protein
MAGATAWRLLRRPPSPICAETGLWTYDEMGLPGTASTTSFDVHFIPLDLATSLLRVLSTRPR